MAESEPLTTPTADAAATKINELEADKITWSVSAESLLRACNERDAAIKDLRAQKAQALEALRAVVSESLAYVDHVQGIEEEYEMERENRSEYRQLVYECDKARAAIAKLEGKG